MNLSPSIHYYNSEHLKLTFYMKAVYRFKHQRPVTQLCVKSRWNAGKVYIKKFGNINRNK